MQTLWSSVAFCTETAQRSWRCHCVLNALPLQSFCSLRAFSAPKSLYDKRYANNSDRKQTNYSKKRNAQLIIPFIMSDLRQQAGLLLVFMQVQQYQNAADAVHIIIGRRRQRRAQRRRRLWVRPWLDEA